MLATGLRLFTIPRPRVRLRAVARWFAIAAVAAYLGFVFLGPNSHEVIAGRVYRTSQLNGDTLAKYIQDKQIRTVVNLRGYCPDFEWYRKEAAACAAAGVSQEDITLSANRLPPPTELKRLIEVFDRTEYPIVLHCKQGADRTGLASAIVLLLYTDASLSRARKELWPHRGHFPVSRTAAMDEFFDRYDAWLNGEAHTSAKFRDWALNHYTPGPAVAELTPLTPIPQSFPSKPFALTLRATNKSKDDWQFQTGATAGIHLEYRVYNANGEKVIEDVAGLLRKTIAPGESIDLMMAFPKLPPGTYTLRAELANFRGAGVAVRAQYFFQFGCEPFMTNLVVK